MSEKQAKTQTVNRATILAVILSGGAGRRFEGADKGLYLHLGKPLIHWVIEAIAPQVSDVLVCINRNSGAYQKLGYKTVNDQSTTFEGPVAGLVAAIDFIDSNNDLGGIKTILLSSCDSPALPSDYVAVLENAMQANHAAAAVVHDGTRNQNLHCLIHKDAWDRIRDFFNEGGRAMHRLHKIIGTVEVDFSDQAAAFLNINSPSQLIDR